MALLKEMTVAGKVATYWKLTKAIKEGEKFRLFFDGYASEKERKSGKKPIFPKNFLVSAKGINEAAETPEEFEASMKEIWKKAKKLPEFKGAEDC
jgi:hypothetical protein